MDNKLVRLISMIVAFQLGLGPVAAASNSSSVAQISNESSTSAAADGSSFKISNDKILINGTLQDMKKGSKLDGKEMSIEVPMSSDAELRQQSPKKIEKILIEMKNIGTATNSGVYHGTVRLLPESAMFFAAMGSVVAVQLLTDYAQNPVGLKQHLEHQVSPVGVFSFWTFMSTQGVASNLMAMYLKNPKFYKMIPYLGMTIGFTAQSLVSELASDPNVWACSKIMMGVSQRGKALTEKEKESGLSEEPCEAAHEHFILSKKITQYAPSLASMLLASVGAAVAQGWIVSAATKVTGVDVALWFVPGKMAVSGLKLVLVNGLRIGLFVHVQALIDRKVTMSWRNMVDSRLMMDTTVDVSREINRLKKSQWSGEATELKAAMRDLHEKMSAWRMANLSEVYEAHENWSQMLGQLSSMYNASLSYYDSFINEIRNSRFKEQEVRLLEITNPLTGVRGNGSANEKDAYFTSPQRMFPSQVATLHKLVTETENDLNSPVSEGLTEVDKREVRDILATLKNNDTKLWEAIKAFAALDKARSNAYQNWPNDRGYIAFLNKMKAKLGNPEPSSLPGQSFNTSYLQQPDKFETVKDASYYRNVGTYITPHITEYLMMQMICGPDLDKNESVVKTTMGLPSVFIPPQIKDSKDSFNFCMSPVSILGNSVYEANIEIDGNTYKGFPQYLINKARSSIVGEQRVSNFPAWWEAKTAAQMKKAYDMYQESYQEIVAKLIEGAFKKENDTLNLSPFANGTMKASVQEAKIYLSILQDLLRPSARVQWDISKLASWTATDPILKDLDTQIQAMGQLIEAKIKVVTLKEKRIVRSRFKNQETTDEKRVVHSDLKNSELDEQLKLVELARTKASEIFGDTSNIPAARIRQGPRPGQVKLNKTQQELAKMCLEQLMNIALEIKNYGTIAHAVSWDKINEVTSQKEKDNSSARSKQVNQQKNTGPIRH